MIEEKENCAVSESILINFASLVHRMQIKPNFSISDNNYIVDTDEVISFCQSLEQKSHCVPYKILATAIHGRIWMFLFANADKAQMCYSECIQFAEKKKIKLSKSVSIIIEEIKKEFAEINDRNNSDSDNDNDDDSEHEDDKQTKQCAYCKKEREKLLQCGRCKCVYYCSIDCQRPHWNRHKLTCRK